MLARLEAHVAEQHLAGSAGSPDAPHDERANVRQYFGPALRAHFGAVALHYV
jgi:hypothetical protein